MSDAPENSTESATPVRRRRAAVGRPAGAPTPVSEAAAPQAASATPADSGASAVKKAPAKRTAAKKAPAKKATKAPASVEVAPAATPAVGEPAPPVKRTRTRATKATFSAVEEPPAPVVREPSRAVVEVTDGGGAPPARRRRRATSAVFLEAEGTQVEPNTDPDAAIVTPGARSARVAPPARVAAPAPADAPEGEPAAREAADDAHDAQDADDADDLTSSGAPRRRRRGGRGRNRGSRPAQSDADGEGGASEDAVASSGPKNASAGGPGEGDATGDGTSGAATARRRQRRRAGEDGDADVDGGGGNVVVRVREPRADKERSEVRGVQGSTRLEAKRQRRKDSRDAPRRRAPLLTEAEFLARRESVERVMLVRQEGEKTQIAVLENGVLAEHYVTRASTTSYAGNVYLGKVQNVLPSMEAAFVDIGKGRNAVLYAGEVNYDVSGLEGKPQRIEQALSSGQDILVQVTKDPIGHKGARLTSQVSLPGRYLVYVPGGSTHGISRKLPDAERSRLKSVLKKIVPDDAGVIVRTAAEGAAEEDLARDVERLAAQWADIEAKTKKAKAPALLYSEPDLVVRVIRDIFNEDVMSLVVQGSSEADTIEEYVAWVAPDLANRVTRWNDEADIFEAHRVDEQLQKALDRKVHLPSGGSLIIERTEAMTVVDVNTGKFVGKGGNLEETVTKNNLEAAEEVVRQLRLRDVGGIIVIDFVDMVLESNRDLVLRRLIESLGRDRTKHNVAEVTSLGLVQMTRKRVGQGLLEAYSTTCDECGGKGHIITNDAPDPSTNKKKGKGIPSGMIPRRTPVEDALAAAEAEDFSGAEAIVDDASGPDPDLELLDTENSHNTGDDEPDTEADEADEAAEAAEDAVNEAVVSASD